jgi:U3 small nucleolar RNA-associated protein 22
MLKYFNINCMFICRLHMQHNSFGAAVRLSKRWLASQLMLNEYIAEEAVELLVASLYITPEPFSVPG